MEVLLSALKEDAWHPNTTDSVIENALSITQNFTQCTTVIFPECGSAYHEWKIFLKMRQINPLLITIV